MDRLPVVVSSAPLRKQAGQNGAPARHLPRWQRPDLQALQSGAQDASDRVWKRRIYGDEPAALNLAAETPNRRPRIIIRRRQIRAYIW